jgi:hypothetical protein
LRKLVESPSSFFLSQIIKAVISIVSIYQWVKLLIYILYKKEQDNDRYAVRMTKYQGSTMINICDIELIGAKLEKDEFLIEITKDYFQQDIIEDSQARKLLRSCSIANLVGERIVKQALDLGLAKEMSIKRISGVPFLMIFKFQYKY